MIGKLAELGTARASRREKIRAKKSGNAFARGIKDFDSTSYGILMKTLAAFPGYLILPRRQGGTLIYIVATGFIISSNDSFI